MIKIILKGALAALILAGLLWYLISTEIYRTLVALPMHLWIISAIIGWSIMIFSSSIIFISRIGALPPAKTLIFFPICQNIAGLVFPFQGSISFAVSYFKYVHNLKAGETIGISSLLLLAHILLLGLTGLWLSDNHENPTSSLLFVLIATFPVLLLSSSYLFERSTRHRQRKENVSGVLIDFIRSIHLQWHTLLKFRALLVLYIFRLTFYLMWFIFLNNALGTSFTTNQLLFLVFLVEASFVLKFTPGNWGVSQASAGIGLALIGGHVEEGILLVTVSMLSILLLNLFAGYFALGHFAQEFALKRRVNLFQDANSE